MKPLIPKCHISSFPLTLILFAYVPMGFSDHQDLPQSATLWLDLIHTKNWPAITQSKGIFAAHHPIFGLFPPFAGPTERGFTLDFLGAYTNASWFCDKTNGAYRLHYPSRENLCHLSEQWEDSAIIQTEYPIIDEEYFEYIDVLDSVIQAKANFTMIEVGAGYGHWSVTAFKALSYLRRRHKVDVMDWHFIAIEPEPFHFSWTQKHFRRNGIDKSKSTFLNCGLGEDGTWGYMTKNSPYRYGAAIHATEKANAYKFRLISLNTVLSSLDHCDLLDVDIQGAEARELSRAIDIIDNKVYKIHVGTHGAGAHKNVFDLFDGRGWINVNDIPRSPSYQHQLYGGIKMLDGVQTWINPKFGRSLFTYYFRNRFYHRK